MENESFKVLAKEGYNDGYYWDMRFLFECDGVRYILIDVGSGSGYISTFKSIKSAPDISLDDLLKDWPEQNEHWLEDEELTLEESFARGMVKHLIESGEDEYTSPDSDEDYEGEFHD